MMACSERSRQGAGRMSEKMVLRNFVAGASVEPAGDQYSDLVDPSTGEVFAAAPVSGQEDVDTAIKAAAEAFESWRDVEPREWQLAKLKFADALESRFDALLDAECRNTGKPRQLTLDEELVPRSEEHTSEIQSREK